MITNYVSAIAEFEMLFKDKEIPLVRCVLNCIEYSESSS